MPFNAWKSVRGHPSSPEESHASTSDGSEVATRFSDSCGNRDLIATHDFRHPECECRVLLFAGRLLPRAAATLVSDAYSRLGYRLREATRAPGEPSVAAVLHAVHGERTLGTLSINLDSASGLAADALYRDQIDRFRAEATSCEFTRLAMDTEHAGREVLCSLFYMAYIFSHIVHRARHLFIEVNPRHQRFYERMLGFSRMGEQKLCQRVGAPAVLMHLDFQFTAEQLHRFRQGLSVGGTTLYRYAAPPAEERALVRQMSAGDTGKI